ncbi:MAG TPA: dTDP-4-dehydrorhamnose 3,5-epimerase family protein [Fimbriimonadaceae bacterium]|nr:dTDP-4-dehydrorhamnose 3,5-epimerase family protein [Fimbriimonadaceae bacterium]
MPVEQAVEGLVGVEVLALEMHGDDRGVFTEVYRDEWGVDPRPKQWNVVRSEANVLRGVHVHIVHHDYLILVDGRATIGLADLRARSASAGATTTLEMSGGDLVALRIPPGVAHGFYFHEPSIHVYSVSEYWNLADELGCHWADPDLGIDWPGIRPHISDRDESLPPLASLQDALASVQNRL